MILKIYTYPEYTEFLRTKTEKVEVIDELVIDLCKNMVETVMALGARGLAAPQVGESKKIIVVSMNGTPVPFINPSIVERKGIKQFLSKERCLSVPNKSGYVLRDKAIKIKAIDMNGQPIVFRALNDLAACFQHEIDHLQGILIVDKLK
jgi:peptide deformylase